MSDLKTLLDNMDEPQLAAIASIAGKVATVKAQKWTGKVTIDIDVLNGGIGMMKMLCGETIKLPKKRSVRSRGVSG